MVHLLAMFLVANPPSLVWSAIPSGGIVDVECAGDLNGDGTDELFCAFGEATGQGILCLDGLSGETIWWNDSIPGVYGTGCLRRTADIDLDGFSDLAAGRGTQSAIIALSGASGETLWTSPQSSPVHFVQSVQGPYPGDVVIVASRYSSGNAITFFALGGQEGNWLWGHSEYTLDQWIRVTDGDASGGGWAEIGYSIDRGSVMNGGAVVRDGFTGAAVGGASNMYNGTMDICTSPVACLAVSNSGDYPVMWMESLISGSLIWGSNDTNLWFPYLDFIPNITGSYYPEILGWSSSQLALIRGEDGYHQDRYTFPGTLQALETYHDGTVWRLAAVTATKFHCPPLVFASPSVEPSFALPGSVGCDLCLLESDAYPTPLVGIAMSGSGPGVCVINTSWPVATENESSASIPPVGAVGLLANPGTGGIILIGERAAEVVIMDITGRVIRTIQVEAGIQTSVDLAPGVYSLVEAGSGTLLCRAVVLN
jgi:hypothetical protein